MAMLTMPPPWGREVGGCEPIFSKDDVRQLLSQADTLQGGAATPWAEF